MVYALDSKSSVERHVGSSPTSGTKLDTKFVVDIIHTSRRKSSVRVSYLPELFY